MQKSLQRFLGVKFTLSWPEVDELIGGDRVILDGISKGFRNVEFSAVKTENIPKILYDTSCDEWCDPVPRHVSQNAE